ncbi:hypothetical protein DL93DRAFT_2230406 [Clavulina sp. PMI_390]|nr:hypothetical protein DL93DRAFT_2230406 [Clavulina sp. PMI_390]
MTTTAVSDREYLSFADGDIVLRSNDCIEFRLDSLILRRASPLFATMLQLPSPTISSRETINLTEPAEVLDDLFRAIYPRSPAPNTSSPEHVFALIKAFDKYQIADGAYLDALHDYWSRTSGSIQAWVYSIRLNHAQMRREAFIRFLSEPEKLPAYDPQLQYVDGATLVHMVNTKQKASELGRRLMGRWAYTCFCGSHDRSSPYVTDILANPLRINVMTDDSLSKAAASCSSCGDRTTSVKIKPKRERYRSALAALLEAAVVAEQSCSELKNPDVMEEVLHEQSIDTVE